MIISRTPYRISFFGGGTDYHTWYREHGAAVLTTTINYYCYLQCRLLPAFFNHQSRIVWTHIEEVMQNEDIKQPSVRAILDYLKINHGVEIHHQGDLPARSGLGSSSAFTVGLLHALYALKGTMSSKVELACEAIHVERDMLRENVGVQDQIQTAFGGFNHITIAPDGNFTVHPVVIPDGKLHKLRDHLLLFFTGVSRNATDIAAEKIKAIPSKKFELYGIQKLVDEALKVLSHGNDITDFGRLLHESWMLKRQISQNISPTFIDEIYAKARAAGAIGGKLLGAGGGGFMLFFVKPEDKEKVCLALEDLLLVPFDFESHGSQLIFYENAHYSQTSMQRRNYRHLNENSDSPIILPDFDKFDRLERIDKLTVKE